MHDGITGTEPSIVYVLVINPNFLKLEAMGLPHMLSGFLPLFECSCHVFQDNEPLMRALSKLIYLNNPDLVLFVGEALVGNDAVDQLSKFNQVPFL